jgi:hypothetical protein
MDRYPAKPILWAAAGMFGFFLFLMIAIGAIMGVVRFFTAPRVSSSAPAIAGGAAVVALISLWLAYLSVRSVVRRIKEANQAALVGRAIWQAQFEAERNRGAGTSAGK